MVKSMRTVYRAFRDARSLSPSRLRETGMKFRREESGSILIFSIFLMILLLFICGMAVDVMRYETRRVAMQNTLDNAVLAASSLTQDLDAETLVRDYVRRAGFDPATVSIVPAETRVNGEALTGRTVRAVSNVSVDTFFMNMMGFDTLDGQSVGTAYEAVQNLEISLIVDISGSMGSNSRLTNLKVAAKEFFDTVLTQNPRSGTTSISIIPYNATVVAGSELLSRLNAAGSTVAIENPPAYPGAMSEYGTEHNDSTCVRFEDDDFDTRSISPTTPLRRVSHFKDNRNSMNAPSMGQRWCNEGRASILVHSTDITELKNHIDSLQAAGYTGIDNGMKWGVALLDPAIGPVITDMVDDGLLSESVRGRPGVLGDYQTMKIIVLMTDGDNTIQRDLKDEYKNGPSRIWYSEVSTKGRISASGRTRTKFDGYFVEMPKNDGSRRWYVPGDPNDSRDDFYAPVGDLPADAVQLDYHELHRRFAADDIATFFFKRSDSAAETAHGNAVYIPESYGTIDDRLADICKAAKANDEILVFAIGFEAPSNGQAAMENCATSIGYYYDVNGTEISAAFSSIAGKITMLRLTE